MNQIQSWKSEHLTDMVLDGAENGNENIFEPVKNVEFCGFLEPQVCMYML